MKIAVRYQSRGGNTKAVAEAIAKEAGVTAETITVPVSDTVDVLFIGGGLYKWGIDSTLKNYLENLDPAIVKSVAAFSTGGGMDGTKKIIDAVKTKGIAAQTQTLPVKFGLRNHALLGGKGFITLKSDQINLVKDFVKKITG